MTIDERVLRYAYNDGCRDAIDSALEGLSAMSVLASHMTGAQVIESIRKGLEAARRQIDG